MNLKHLIVSERQPMLFIITRDGLPLYPSQGATVEFWGRKLRQLEIQNK